MKRKFPVKRMFKIFYGLLAGCGTVSVLLMLSCFTPLPWRLYYWLASPPATYEGRPDVIVVMGGGGIPSESGLMRTYQAARVAGIHTNAAVMISIPGEPERKGSAPDGMADELIRRGVSAHRLLYESQGCNTREQALFAMRLLGTNSQPNLCMVTSPEHMRRCVATFTKAGFINVAGSSAFDAGIDVDLTVRHRELGARQGPAIIRKNLALRYTFWTQMKYGVVSLRELAALLYYHLNDWV